MRYGKQVVNHKLYSNAANAQVLQEPGLGRLNLWLKVKSKKYIPRSEIDRLVCASWFSCSEKVRCELTRIAIGLLESGINRLNAITNGRIHKPFAKDISYHALDARFSIALHQLRNIDQ